MALLKSFVAKVKFFLDLYAAPLVELVFGLIYCKIDKRNPLPPIESPFLLLPTHELAKRIRRREVI